MVRLQWSPAEFWAATMTELFSAMDFWAEANGVKRRGTAPTRERLNHLKKLYGG